LSAGAASLIAGSSIAYSRDSNESEEEVIEYFRPGPEALQIAEKLTLTLQPQYAADVIKLSEDLAMNPTYRQYLDEQPGFQKLVADAARSRGLPHGAIQHREICAPITLDEIRSLNIFKQAEGKRDLEAVSESLPSSALLSEGHGLHSFIKVGQSLLDADNSTQSLLSNDIQSESNRVPEEKVDENKDTWTTKFAEYMCAICLDVIFGCHVVDCQEGHSFCGGCIKQHIECKNGAGVTCPLCQDQITSCIPVKIVDKTISKLVQESANCTEKSEWLQKSKPQSKSAAYQDDTHGQESFHSVENNPGASPPSNPTREFLFGVVAGISLVIVAVVMIARAAMK